MLLFLCTSINAAFNRNIFMVEFKRNFKATSVYGRKGLSCIVGRRLGPSILSSSACTFSCGCKVFREEVGNQEMQIQSPVDFKYLEYQEFPERNFRDNEDLHRPGFWMADFRNSWPGQLAFAFFYLCICVLVL